MKKAVLAILLVSILIFSSATAGEPQKKYESPTSGPVLQLLQNGSKVYVLTSGGSLEAYEIKSGKSLWKSKVPEAKALTIGQDFVAVAAGKNLLSFSAESGKPMGKVALPVTIDAGTKVSPKVIADTILLEQNGETIAYQIKTQKTLAKAKCFGLSGQKDAARNSPFWNSAFNENSKTLAMIDVASEEVRLIDLSSGRVLWSTKTEKPEGFPTITTDWVLTQSPGFLTAFDLKTGRLLNKAPMNTRSPIFPEIHFMDSSKTVLASGSDRLIQQNPQSDKTKLDLIVPGRIDLILGENTRVYFIYRYTRESDKKEMSALMCHNVKNAQLYGREPEEGNATGLFAVSDTYIVAELAPGKIKIALKEDMLKLALLTLEAPAAGLALDGTQLVVATTDGKILGWDLASLK